jgi:hypothetical protein
MEDERRGVTARAHERLKAGSWIIGVAAVIEATALLLSQIQTAGETEQHQMKARISRSVMFDGFKAQLGELKVADTARAETIASLRERVAKVEGRLDEMSASGLASFVELELLREELRFAEDELIAAGAPPMSSGRGLGGGGGVSIGFDGVAAEAVAAEAADVDPAPESKYPETFDDLEAQVEQMYRQHIEEEE